MMNETIEVPKAWAAVWGFGSTSSEVGELGTFPTRQEAEKAAADYLRRETNTAVGAWVRPATRRHSRGD